MLDEDITLKITTKWVLDLKTKEAQDKVNKASKQGLKDVVTDIANDAIQGSPYLTGHNRRSIKYEVGPGKEVAKEELSGAVYSTSGYGGYLETGLVSKNYPPRPYFKPALDRNIKNLPKEIKAELR